MNCDGFLPKKQKNYLPLSFSHSIITCSLVSKYCRGRIHLSENVTAPNILLLTPIFYLSQLTCNKSYGRKICYTGTISIVLPKNTLMASPPKIIASTKNFM